MTYDVEPIRPLTSLREKVILVLALVVVGALFLTASLYSSGTPDLAAIRAVKQAVGPDAAEIRVSGRYQFEDVDGSSYGGIQLACGTVVQRGERRAFAALVGGSGKHGFEVVELAIQLPGERRMLAREAQLLGACQD